MDKFFTQKTCDRCGGSLDGGRIMSMLNTDCLCLSCKNKEQQHQKYKQGTETELAEIKKGNYNYRGLLKEQKITNKLLEQILEIRDLGKYNMFDVSGVQKEAYERNYFELVNLIEEDIRTYLNFILYGTRR